MPALLEFISGFEIKLGHTIMRFIASPALMVLGFLLMKYTVQITRATGPISLAEQYLNGFGGTYAWWRIWGFAILLFGLLWLTGVIQYGVSNNALSTPLQ